MSAGALHLARAADDNGWFWRAHQGGFFTRVRSDGHDGWVYRRELIGGRFVYRKAYRIASSNPFSSKLFTTGRGDYQDRILALLARRLENEARLRQAALNYNAFVGAIQAAGLSGYAAGDATQYAYTYRGVTDAFRNLDVDARLKDLQLLAEEVQQGSLQVSRETAQTLARAIDSYSALKTAESRAAGAASLRQRFHGLLDSPTTSAPSPVVNSSPALTILENECFKCHGGPQTAEGQKLRFVAADGQGVFSLKHLEPFWTHRIVEKVSSGEMPPGKKLTDAQKRTIYAGLGEAMSGGQ